MQEAVRGWAYSVGINRQDQQWLLSDYDSWERNPHYVGPEQGHPEFDMPVCVVYLTFKEAAAAAKQIAMNTGTDVPLVNYKDRCWVIYN